MSKAGPEKMLQNSIIHWLRVHGIFCWPVYNGGVYDPTKKVFRTNGKYYMPGVSDILGCHAGKFFAIEVKTRLGRLTEHQKTFLKEFADKGGHTCVVRSIEDLERFINESLLSSKPK